MVLKSAAGILGSICLLLLSFIGLSANEPAYGTSQEPSARGLNASTRRGDWWMFGRDPQHRRYSPFTGPSTATVKWECIICDESSHQTWTPISLAADGTLYVGSNHLYAINPDGTVEWEFECGEVWSTPAIGDDGTLYFGSDDRKFYALYPDGSPKWTQACGDRITSSPAIGEDGTIYVCLDKSLFALSPEGTEKWRYDTSWDTNSSPAIGRDGTIYFASTDFDTRSSELYALTAAGEVLWSCPLNDYAYSPVIAPDESIYINSVHTLFAVSNKGAVRWRCEVDSVNYSDPAIAADGTIYVGGRGKLHAINPDGSSRWESELSGSTTCAYSSPTVGANGVIYIGGGYTNKVYAFRSDGSLLWEHETTAAVNCAPVIAPDSTLYIGGWDCKLYAFVDLETP